MASHDRGRRYPPKLIAFVEKLGRNGYRIVEAQAAVAKLPDIEHVPSRSTIARWLDPDAWEAFRQSQRKGRLPGPQPRVKWTWQRKMERLRELGGLGISTKAVAKVMNHDYGLKLTAHTVRQLLDDYYQQDDVERLLGGRHPRRGPRPVASI